MVRPRIATSAGEESKKGAAAMELWTLLGVLIAIIVIGYAVVNIVFRVATDLVTFIEENKVGVLVILVILAGLWFGWRS